MTDLSRQATSRKAANGHKPLILEEKKMTLEKVQNILADQFEVAADSISADTNIVDDLGADSLYVDPAEDAQCGKS